MWNHFAGWGVASAVAFPGLVMAALFLSWSFRNAAGWQVIYPVTFLIAVGVFAALVSMIVGVGMPGLQQRAFFVLFWSGFQSLPIAWFVLVEPGSTTMELSTSRCRNTYPQ